jgi:hypothetical protein
VANTAAIMKDMEYVDSIPHSIPAGRVLVHNHATRLVRPKTPPGSRGFRAWFAPPSDKLLVCRCSWSGLKHYRVRAIVESAETRERRAIARGFKK